jgi:hypothetical protein
MTLEPGAAAPAAYGASPIFRPSNPPVSWGAIFAGAAVGLGISLVLTVLAAGLGLSLGYPGLATRASLGAFTPEFGAYAVAVQVLSAGFAGYLAGRLRHIWADAHGDEAHFRDTAHGAVAWALMTLAGVVLAALVLGPYLDALSGPIAAAATPVDAERAAKIAAQSSFFIAVGMLLSAFTAAVAGRIGGMQAETMHARLS